MKFRSPGKFRSAQDFRAYLRTVAPELDCDLELAEIHRRVIAADGPALLFTNPKGYDIPVVTNLFGTKKRVDLAFGPRPEEFVRRAVRLATKELIPPTFGKLWENRDLAWQGINIGMKDIGRGPVTEVVDIVEIFVLWISSVIS